MKPLQGVRIVSVEQFGAAPYGTMLLADLGAEVIKVENAAIGGDPARKTGPYLLGPMTANITRHSISTRRAWRSTCAWPRARPH
jgi:crotonobetainyl-CoA:carnitine CoA-transferase CaiB-like acyl-CoA transferase